MHKQQEWIVSPEVGLVQTLSSYGRFLENDYRMAIETMAIPPAFEEYTEETGRRFVIVGAKSVPGATAKSVFLCLKLAGAESIVVKAPTMDEYFMILNVVEYHADNPSRVRVFHSSSDELRLDSDWRDALDKATDIVVFGGQETVDTFLDLETEECRVHVHGPKFSFGIVRAYDLTPSVIKEICVDFYTFYGEGCLSPKFYFIVGEVSNSMFQEIGNTMKAYFGSFIDEFRSKFPLTRKSELAQQLVSANYRTKYIREEELKVDKIFTNLHGDARFVVVDSVDDIENFIRRWSFNISTVAIDSNDDEIIEFLEDNLIVRICDYGYMQSPDFFEQFDTIDDFDIYVGDER